MQDALTLASEYKRCKSVAIRHERRYLTGEQYADEWLSSSALYAERARFLYSRIRAMLTQGNSELESYLCLYGIHDF